MHPALLESRIILGTQQVGTEKIGLLTENPENLEVYFMLNVFVFS